MPSPGRPTRRSPSGQFGVWVDQPGDRLVRRQARRRQRHRPATRPALDAQRPRRHRLHAWSSTTAPTAGSGAWRRIRRRAPARSTSRRRPASITVTAPNGTEQLAAGQHPAGHLDDQRRGPAGGQFGVWVISPTTGWYVGKLRARRRHDHLHAQPRRSTCPPARLQRRRLLPRRPTQLGLEHLRPRAPGTVDVTAGAPLHHRRPCPVGTEHLAHGQPRCRSAGRSNAAVAVGRVRRLARQPDDRRLVRRRLLRRRRRHRPATRTSFDARRARRRSYKSIVYYRPTRRSRLWGRNGVSPGAVSVTF